MERTPNQVLRVREVRGSLEEQELAESGRGKPSCRGNSKIRRDVSLVFWGTTNTSI